MTQEELDNLELHLQALRHGCGVHMSMAEIGEMEWPDLQRKSELLTEFLERCLPQPKQQTTSGFTWGEEPPT